MRKDYNSDYAQNHAVGRNWEFNKIISLARPTKEMKILDIGCNLGQLDTLLSRRYHCLVTGIDINRVAITKARKDFPYINFLAGDFLKIGFHERFDCIIMVETIEHFASPEAVLTKVVRLLKKNGKLIISTPNKNAYFLRLRCFFRGKRFNYDPTHEVNFFSNRELSKILIASKLTVENIITEPLGIPFLRFLPTFYRFILSLGVGGTLFAVARKN